MRRSLAGLCLCAPLSLLAQERGAPRLNQLIASLTVTPRVLIIGAHPEDDDPQLMTWLALGSHVQTAYLSLTRGEAGQNFAGSESGSALGAVRTRELLAARRIDGGELFFARAVDYGMSKTAADAFRHWPHDEILGDIVAIVRSFRPHVIVAARAATAADSNGHHEALAILVREAFDAAADTVRYAASGAFGKPWRPLKLYRYGDGITMDLGAFDIVSGRTLADVARESRAQHRTQGFFDDALRLKTTVSLQLIASRTTDSTLATKETSIFDGIDTTFARLAIGATPRAADALKSVAAYADSARAILNLARPAEVVQFLARTARAAATARRYASWCRRPSTEPAMLTFAASAECDQRALDLDAALDLVQRRATDALLLAAGVRFEVVADRDLVATSDTVPVELTMYNHGVDSVTLADVSIGGSRRVSMNPVIIPPGGSARETRGVTALVNPHPWWMVKRVGDMFGFVGGPLDGLERGAALPDRLTVPGITIPEAMRRESDATVTVSIGGTTFTKSLGPVIHRYADALVGPQERPVSGVAPVTLAFSRGLEWIVANKSVTRRLRLKARSFSDRDQEFKLNTVTPPGLRVDSIPESITLTPHEFREISLPARAKLDTGRYVFGVVGESPRGARFTMGFQLLQYPHLTPLRFFRSSGVYLQAVDVNVPASLSVVYVNGTADDSPDALRGIGVPVRQVSVDELALADLARVSTVVIGPRALDAYPQLTDHAGRLMDFARKGGTVVVLQQREPSRLLPQPVSLAAPFPEAIATPDAVVKPIDPRSRVLNWPNVIGDNDWTGWVSARAVFVPTSVHASWTTPLEMRDKDERPNRNSVLISKAGKGTYVYTTLSLEQQIASGVSGALRLLVNLVSVGLAPDGSARR